MSDTSKIMAVAAFFGLGMVFRKITKMVLRKTLDNEGPYWKLEDGWYYWESHCSIFYEIAILPLALILPHLGMSLPEILSDPSSGAWNAAGLLAHYAVICHMGKDFEFDVGSKFLFRLPKGSAPWLFWHHLIVLFATAGLALYGKAVVPMAAATLVMELGSAAYNWTFIDTSPQVKLFYRGFMTLSNILGLVCLIISFEYGYNLLAWIALLAVGFFLLHLRTKTAFEKFGTETVWAMVCFVILAAMVIAARLKKIINFKQFLSTNSAVLEGTATFVSVDESSKSENHAGEVEQMSHGGSEQMEYGVPAQGMLLDFSSSESSDCAAFLLVGITLTFALLLLLRKFRSRKQICRVDPESFSVELYQPTFPAAVA